MTLFPMFLKLESKRCLVVGAGTVGEGKIASLLDAGACVVVIAPKATAAVQALASARSIDWQARDFVTPDLDDVFLVVSATNSRGVNSRVKAEAQARGILCNVVDVPELCDFYYPAIVRRGNLQIAVSTGGQSPALAQRIRRELERQYPDEYSNWLEEVGSHRRQTSASPAGFEERRRARHEAVTAESFAKFLRKRASTEIERGEG